LKELAGICFLLKAMFKSNFGKKRKICVFFWVNLDSFPQILHCADQEEKVDEKQKL
jgi:hypothetical protein